MTADRDYPRIVVPPPGPKARGIVERQDRFASTSYPKEYPLAVARGQGPMVEDVDGNRFLDFMAGIAVASTGYGHPKVVKAVQDAAARFLHICGSDFYYESFAALCERLAQLAPGPSKKLPGRLPWAELRRLEPHREQSGAAVRIRPVSARSPPRAVRVSLSL